MWEWVKGKSLKHRGYRSPMGDVGTFLGWWLYFRGKWRQTWRTKKTHVQSCILFAYDVKSVHVFDFKICRFSPIKKTKNKSTFEYNQHQIILTSWNQRVCFSTVGIPPTQCIKSEPWIHFRTRSRARSRLMQCRRLWSPSSRAVMSSLPHIWKLFLGRILRRAASLKCMSHLLCSSAPWDLN